MKVPARGASAKAPSPFPPTEVSEVFGSLAFAGEAKTLQEMDAAVADGVRRAAEEANRSDPEEL